MKKFLIIAGIVIAILVAWKYFKKPIISSAPTKAVENTMNSVGDYIPNMIDNKNQAQQRVDDISKKQQEKLDEAMGQ